MAKRLVCEADVLAMAPGTELVLDGATIATPSALDAAPRRGVRVVRPGERNAAAPASTQRASTLERLLEKDGTYVVVVRAGRASVTRVEPV